MVRLQIVLDFEEADALQTLALGELRDPRDQVRLIVRRELQHRKLLSADLAPSRGDPTVNSAPDRPPDQ